MPDPADPGPAAETTMTVSKWTCEKCRASGEIRLPINADVYEYLEAIRKDHVITSPQCDPDLARFRVDTCEPESPMPPANPPPASDATPTPGALNPSTVMDADEHRHCYKCGIDLAGRIAHLDEVGDAWCVSCEWTRANPTPAVTAPLECIRCGVKGPQHPVDGDHPGWLCRECKASTIAGPDASLSPDHPDADFTDCAHPAWWRGHDSAVAGVVGKLTDILDGKDDGSGVASGEYEVLRRRLLALVLKADAGGAGDVGELERLARAATPGPWTFGRKIKCNGDGCEHCWHTFDEQADVFPPLGESGPVATVSVIDHDNHEYIAAANPAAVLALIARLRELEADVSQLLKAGPLAVSRVVAERDALRAAVEGMASFVEDFDWEYLTIDGVDCADTQSGVAAIVAEMRSRAALAPSAAPAKEEGRESIASRERIFGGWAQGDPD